MSFLTSFLRSHHTNLVDPPNSLRTFLHYLDEQRSSSDHGHRDAFTPFFNVREGPFAYFLEGEFPGVRDKGAISIEWAAHRTLVIRATISRVDLEAEWGREIVGSDEQDSADIEQKSHHHHDYHGERSTKKIKTWIHERNIGEFERTFTFPREIEPSGMRARLEQGLLKVLVPKMTEYAPETRRIEIE